LRSESKAQRAEAKGKDEARGDGHKEGSDVCPDCAETQAKHEVDRLLKSNLPGRVEVIALGGKVGAERKKQKTVNKNPLT
jgi:hypothetical protein